MRPRLRLFDETTASEIDQPIPQLSVQLTDFLGVLRDAAKADRAWLDDFGDEEVQVSRDLFEILSAYRRIQASDDSQDKCA